MVSALLNLATYLITVASEFSKLPDINLVAVAVLFRSPKEISDAAGNNAEAASYELSEWAELKMF